MTHFASVAELKKAIAGSDVVLPAELQESAQPGATGNTQPSSLEVLFEHIWGALGGPRLEREYRFSERGWRFDFALPEQRIAIEIEGGLYRGRHTQAKGFIEDCHKYNAATMAGWRVIRLTTAHLSPLHIQPIIDWTAK